MTAARALVGAGVIALGALLVAAQVVRVEGAIRVVAG